MNVEFFDNLGTVCFALSGILLLCILILYILLAVISAIKEAVVESRELTVVQLIKDVDKTISDLQAEALLIYDLDDPEVTKHYMLVDMSIGNLQELNRNLCALGIPEEHAGYLKDKNK